MRLTELIIAAAIFLLAVAVFSAGLITVRRSVGEAEEVSEQAVYLLDTDSLIRKELRKIKVPYWKNFDSEFEKEKVILEENLKRLGEERGFEVTGICSVYDKSHNAEGIKVTWQCHGKGYECLEIIKQRIVSEG